MKKLVQVVEMENQGLSALLGQPVVLFCMNYIYAGELVGVNDTDVILKDAQIVYETGPLGGKFKDAQKLPSGEWRIRTSSIESYGVWP